MSGPNLTRQTRVALSLAYPKPLAWNVPAARIFGIRLVAADSISSELLAAAESDSMAATRYLAILLASAIPVIVVSQILIIASWLVGTAIGLTIGLEFADWVLLPISVLPGIVLVFGTWLIARLSARAASSGLSIAIRMVESGERPDLSAYPRMEYVLMRFVAPLPGGA